MGLTQAASQDGDRPDQQAQPRFPLEGRRRLPLRNSKKAQIAPGCTSTGTLPARRAPGRTSLLCLASPPLAERGRLTQALALIWGLALDPWGGFWSRPLDASDRHRLAALIGHRCSAATGPCPPSVWLALLRATRLKLLEQAGLGLLKELLLGSKPLRHPGGPH